MEHQRSVQGRGEWALERILRVVQPGDDRVLPEPYGSVYSPLETLAFLAGRTSTIRLGFGFNPGIFEWAGFETQLSAYLDAVPQGKPPVPVVVRVNGFVTAEPLGADRPPLVGDVAQVREDLARAASLSVDEVFWDLIQGGVPHAEQPGVLDRIVQLKD